MTCKTKNQNGAGTPTQESLKGHVEIPAQVSDGTNYYTVIAIDDYSFAYFPNITSITIPSTVTSIGDHAFDSCKSLESIDIPSSVQTIGLCCFNWDAKLKSIKIPDSVTELGGLAFYGCTALESVVLSNSLSVLPEDIFEYCSSLKSIVIPNSVKEIGDKAFYGCTSLETAVISDQLQVIPDDMFWGCTALKYVRIPDSVHTINIGAFQDCENLELDTINPNITKIERAFRGCKKITNLTFSYSETPLQVDIATFLDCPLTEVYYNRELVKYNNKTVTSASTLIPTLETVKIGPKINDYNFNNSCLFKNENGLKLVTIEYADNILNISSGASFGEVSESIQTLELCRNIKRYCPPNIYESEKQTAFNNAAHVIFGDNVSYLDDYMFANSDYLTEIYIPSNIKKIGREAFLNSKKLTKIEFAEGVESIGDSAFEGCTSLTEISLPNSLTSIGWETFMNCNGLTKVNLGQGVTTMGTRSFYGCSSLVDITLSNSLEGIDPEMFRDCLALENITLPPNIAYIGSSAFSRCKALKTITIPKSVQKVGGAFTDCESLTSFIVEDGENLITFYNDALAYSPIETLYLGRNWVYKKINSGKEEVLLSPITNSNLIHLTLGAGVTELYESAFMRCPKLQDVTINGPLKKIGHNSFKECGELQTVNFSNNLETIADNSFESCSKLKEVILPSTIRTIGEFAFNGCSQMTSFLIQKNENENNGTLSLGNKSFYNCKSLISFDLGNVLCNIGEAAFFNCSSLENMPDCDYITGMGNNAFYGCSSIKKISIPSKVTNVEESVFANCSKATEIYIHENVKSIGKNAFYNCDDVKNVQSDAIVPPVIQSTTFPSYPFSKATLIIPDNTALDYIDAPWWIVFRNLSEVASGKTVKLYNDGVFEYRLISGNENQAILISPKSTNVSAVSIPRRVAVEDHSGNATFYAVTHVRRNAFQNYTAMERLVLPTSLIEVGDSSFYNCSSLGELSFKEGLERIGANAFASCKSLTGVALPSTLKKVGQKAFEGDSIIAKTEIPDIAPWCAVEFCDSLSNPIYYSKNLHVGGSLIENLTIPSGVKRIREYAFEKCHSIKSLELPNTLQTVKPHAFYDCRNFSSLTIPVSVDTLEISAFKNCLALDNLKITDSKNELYIESGTFEGAPLKEIYIGRNYGQWNDVFTQGKTENVHIGNLVTTIPSGGFSDLSTLKNVVIGSEVELIGSNAFNRCSLTDVVIPSKVINISNRAFANNKLEKLTIGEGIKSIGSYAFEGNDALETICITALTPPSAENNTFSYYGGTLNVTPGCESAYEDYPRCWYRFTSYGLIVAESVEVDKTEVTASPGEQFQLTATISPENATLKTILWSSTNTDIATVDNNGLVTMVIPSENQLERISPYSTEDPCEIHAYTLYSDSPIAVCRINAVPTGVEDVELPEDNNFSENMPVEVYNLSGIRVSDSTKNLAPGIYIVRQGAKSRKISVR